MSKSLIFPKQNERKRKSPLLGTRNLGTVVLALSLIVLILLVSVISTCQSNSKKVTKKTYEAGIAAVTNQLAGLSSRVDAQSAQISGLSAQLATVNNSVATLSNSVSANQASIGSIQAAVQAATEQLAAFQPVSPADVAGIRDSVSSLSARAAGDATGIRDSVNGLSARVTELEKRTSSSGLVAGGQSTTVNGLQVTSLVNNVAVGSGMKTVPLAVRIANVNAFAVNKVDIAGTITLSTVIPFASGYPIVSDGAGAVSYVTTFSASTTQVIGFEAYATPAGAAISIPTGGSITLRPVVTLGTVAPVIGYTSTFTLAITAIAFDKGK
jgi:uncharacterized coiled-coil protein SlyX